MRKNFFDALNDWIREVEFSLVNLVSTVAPWLAPLAPAYLSFTHMNEFLNFPLWVSFSIAGVVEMLGLSTISTALMFWNHNRRYSADRNKVPISVPIISFLFYLGIVLTVNVLLEINQDGVALVVAKALLTLLTIPAAVTLAVRTMHQELKEGLKAPKKEVSGNLPKVSEILPPHSLDWRNLNHSDRMKVSVCSVKEVVDEFSVSERTARNWKDQATKYAEKYVYSEKK